MKNPVYEASSLSHGQNALWYLNRVEPGSTAYHLGVCLKLTGRLDEPALTAAWEDIGIAHPQLRARFTFRDGQPSILIDPTPAPMRVEIGGEKDLHQHWKNIAGSPFVLKSESPARALLLCGPNGASFLLLCMHHVVGDLWSAATMLRELSINYAAYASGGIPAVLRERMAYAEFTASEHRWLIGPQGVAASDFWSKHFEGTNTEPILTRIVAAEKRGEIPIALEATVSALVQRAARERNTTPYSVLLACYAQLLAEEADRDELIIGTPATLRDRAALRNTVGYLVNTVPIRCSVATRDPVSAVAINAREALARRRFPFSALVEQLRVARAPGVTPLIQSIFAYQALPREDRALLPLALNADGVKWEFGAGITAETVAMPAFDAQFPIALTLGRRGEEFNGRLQYDGRRMTAANATRLAKQFPELIREFLSTKKSKQRNVVAQQREDRFEDLFYDTVNRSPNAIAMSECGMKLTYAQVKVRVEALAAGLDAALSGRDGPIALQMPSCAEASILILAILKSGHAFQPIEPGEPQARRNAALLRTGACALLSPTCIDPGDLPHGVVALDLEKLKASASTGVRAKTPSATAYFIFTSGSTGEPKAVEVGHAAVMNHARAAARIFGLRPDDRVLQFHTLAFDAAFEEIFPSWAVGARIIYEPESRELGIPAFLEMIARRGITVLNLPASYWHTLTVEAVRLKWQPASHLRLLVVGGERASEKIYSAWRKLAPRCRWINTYGPTEATITALSYEPPMGALVRGALPIGRPIDGVSAFILNADGRRMREGELYLGGKSLALGYKGDPQTSAAKFVQRTIEGKNWRLYRTGDRVKIRKDGNFEYLGRIDRQLKIRGYRVDPEEIERALRAHPKIIDAAVAPQKLGGELTLSAWIHRVNGTPTDPELRAHLAERLPAHMIPSRLTFVPRIPRKPSGKIDSLALVNPPRRSTEDRSPGLRELTAIFSELLGHKILPNDDFFLSGGHSLLVIKLLGRIESRYGVRLSVSDFVEAPTAKVLWSRLRKATSLPVLAVDERVLAETPVSAQQRRALVAYDVGCPSLANIVLLFRVEGQIDEDVLAHAVETVARRHFLLRSGFLQTSAGVVLRDTGKSPELERRILRGRDFKCAVANLAQLEGNQSFALDGKNPWFRLLLVSGPKNKNRHLMLITHHAVADGWALELLFDELRNSYNYTRKGFRGNQQPAKDYRIHAVGQARWLCSPEAKAQTAFWKQRLLHAKHPHLPFHRSASLETSWRIERREIILPAQLTRNLRKVASSYGTTHFALAMACFKAQIHRYSGQTDILLGTVVSNRTTEADHEVFGPLQNPALIRDEVSPNLRMRDLARRVARSLAKAQDNGALPFEHVIREALPHSMSTGMDGGIQFLSHDRTAGKLRLGNASLRLVELPAEESPFELSIALSTTSPRARVVFEYRPSAYSSAGIERLTQQYLAILKSVAAAPNATVGDLNLTPAKEHRALARRVCASRRPCTELLHDGFEAQVRRSPDALAIAARERRLTYGELNAMSEATAGALASGGLTPGGLVAVMLPKGWEQIVACLAVLKAGGVYVPMDPTLPSARLKAIFNQGGFHGAIVTDTRLGSEEPWADRLHSMVTIYSQAERTFSLPRASAKPDSSAYIIFTSGSTGIPKGVMIDHQAAMTTIAEMNRRFQLRPEDRVLAVSALGFDLSVFDIFATLRAGGTIVMPETRDPRAWLDQIVAERVTVWNSVPCLFALLMDEAATRGIYPETLRLIMLSGDFTPLALARRTRSLLPQARLVSLGGATEGSIWSIAHEVKEVDPTWRSVPYGRALKGHEIFVLDPALNHCAAGVTGELFIAGAGLAKGYWRNRTETNRRFLIHPCWKIQLYRTGDQGRYLESGEIEILGRIDEQVKINGFRFELGEVEAALGSLPSVRQALAEVRIDAAGNKRVVVFIAAESGTTNSMLLTQARKLLPATPMPAACIVLDRLPVTPNGKVDRVTLRAMPLPALSNSTALPENPAEKWIAELWSSLLGGATVGVDDDFFALGGHSLLAIQMLQRVRSHFAVDLPLPLVIERPTVRGLANAIGEATTRAPKAGLPRRATAELEHDTEPVMSPVTGRRRRRLDAVLLTGATGHLGSALLAELLRNTDDRIYCLVRSRSESEAEARILNAVQPHELTTIAMQRIVVIPADLGRERFGLDSTAFNALAADIRAAYHCAAEINFMAPYEKLAASNVGGVREMIRLVSMNDAILHHVSSVAVFPYGSDRILREDEDISQITMLAGGYAQSKWASERMVWKAISQGLRATIYRPAQIIDRRKTGPPQDLFEHVLRTCATLGAVPDINAKMDMVTADYAAAAIRCLSNQKSSLGKAFHLVHPQPLLLRDFVGLLPKPLPIVPLESWLELLRKESARVDDSSLHFVSLLSQGLGRNDLTPPGFDCSNTIAGLRGTKVLCPALDEQFIKVNIAQAQQR